MRDLGVPEGDFLDVIRGLDPHFDEKISIITKIKRAIEIEEEAGEFFSSINLSELIG